MMFSEESFEMEKQMGCMAGIFQIFDRQHLLTGRRSGRRGQKRLPSGNNASSNKVVQSKFSHQATLEKTLSKITENSSVSMESSRASCSSLSSSSFSSVNETFYTEKPLKETLTPKNETFFTEKPLKETVKPKTALDLRDIVKESINREVVRGLTVKTEKITKKDEIEIPKKIGSTRKDSPRPVLLSKSMDGTYVIGIDRSINNNNYSNVNEYKYNISNNNNVYYSRYSCDGRDLGPQNCTNNNNNNNARLMKDLPRLSLDSRKESLKKSNFDQSFDSPGQHRRSNSLIARLMGLELLPDLGAEIGEKIEIKTRRDSCLARNLMENEVQIQNSKFENEIQNSNFENLVVKTRRNEAESAPWRQQEKNVGTKLESEIQKKLRGFQKKGEGFDKRGEKTPKGFESPIVIMKPAKNGSENNKSNEFVEKKKSFKQGSNIKQTNKESGLNLNSPRTPPRISQKNRDSDRKSTNKNSVNSFSDLGSPKSKINRPASPKMKKNLSKKLDQEAEITTPRRTSNYKVIKENASEKEMAVVSPVSVLDMSFYQDELTPQKRLSDSFKDGETCTSEESWASDPIKSENIETLIQKLEQLSSANDEPPSGDLTSQETLKSKDHEYVHEILFASGLLSKDLSFIAPINPDLFFVLEQTKIGDKNNRKLIFDLVNEILARKLESKGPFCATKVGGERLFEDLCKEIDEIQNNSKHVEFECVEFDKQDDGFAIPDSEMIREMKGWEKFETEIEGMVFEIEKSIFRDLIDEVVETNNNNQRRMRRQLF